MVLTSGRRRPPRWSAAAAGLLLVLTGCTTTTSGPDTGAASGGVTGTGAPTSALSEATTSGSAGPTDPEPATSTVTTSDAAASTDAASTPATTTAVTPTLVIYTPPADAEATDGDCPYLTKDQVQADTGQRMGPTRIRAAAPAPVCEFVRNDGKYLATVRVLQLDSDALAVAAVDHYVPRETSNPESRPAGWTGGSLATADGSTYGVSHGTYAVIATTNQKQSVYARLLVVHAIESLGL